MHLYLAWRNVWRNPKRTGIILTAVIIGAWTMLAFTALSRGMMVSTLENALNTLTGHIQIQNPAFRDDPVVENRISNPAPVADLLNHDLPAGSRWAFRIQVDGVASNARNSEGITIVGIVPEKEPGLSFYGNSIAQGRLLDPGDDRGIVVGEALLDSFETKIGRKLVLMTQGADRETASRAYKIRGTFRTEMEATEKKYVFISLAAARKLLGIGDGVTSACIRLPDRNPLDRAALGQAAQALTKDLPKDLTVLTWIEMLPLLKGYLDMFDRFMLLWYLVVFTAMAFGLVNTMLMAVLERTREFGLLKALGLTPVRIVRNVLLECLVLLVIGLAAGNVLGFLTIRLLSGGIDMSFMAQGSEFFGMGRLVIPFFTVRDLLSVNAVIMGLGILVCLYPAARAGQITPVEAMART
ncbi:ABC transporter permease [Desulfospira joergensenii]|uniref:ABC transporter permease n=1 Tax=Desulfospira joergensenii TaxID=53329 RepID=UPI0003B30D3E|nr:FtsX-like permease family protein [Desulfospira joergensenii]